MTVIKDIMFLDNGNVAVFDINGNQIQRFQGNLFYNHFKKIKRLGGTFHKKLKIRPNEHEWIIHATKGVNAEN